MSGVTSLYRPLNQQPSLVTTLLDADLFRLLDNLPRDPEVQHHVIAEAWLRAWLYMGSDLPEFRAAIERLAQQRIAGFSDAFRRGFNQFLLPLRTKDLGRDLANLKSPVPEEIRVWGLLSVRVRSFLEADGIIPLIRGDQAISIPFKFQASSGAACIDPRNQPIHHWAVLVGDLITQGIVPSGQAVRIEATFSAEAPAPEGRSLALPIALAWARREAREVGLFPPLVLLATGDLRGRQLTAVLGTGGTGGDNQESGAKTELARRLGALFFVGADLASESTNARGRRVYSYISGTSWDKLRADVFKTIGKARIPDSARHLRRVEEEDFVLVDESKGEPQELWSVWRRLGLLQAFFHQQGNSEKVNQVESRRRRVAARLGFKTLAAGYLNFSLVEKRHNRTDLVGRKKEIQELDDFVNGRPGLLLVTAPVGHGKSALLTHWRKQLVAKDQHSVFYHYFDQNDDRLQSRGIFYRRLLEHLLLVAQTEEGLSASETTDDALLNAWERWSEKRGRRPLVLVIDGLDEAGRVDDYTGQNIAEICPPPLPKGVALPDNLWIVASCRAGENAALHPTALRWKRQAGDTCRELELRPLAESGIGRWVVQWADKLPASLRSGLPPPATLVAAVLDRSEGVALSVHWLLEDIADALRHGRSWDEVLKVTPKGVTRQMLSQWQRLNDAANNPDLPAAMQAREIVLQLVAAKGPLTNGELVSLLGLPPAANLNNIYFEARRWITVQSQEKADPKWGSIFSLNHSIVRQAFSAPLTSTKADPDVDYTGEAARLRSLIEQHYTPKLLAFCAEHWREGSPYALRHFDDHLLQARNWRELDTLLAASGYLRMQQEAFPDEPGLALARVRQALETECLREDPASAVITELVLTHASMVRLLSKPIIREEHEPKDAAAFLRRAEEMTRLPVQWEPAATRMWHLLAGWLEHENDHTANRDLHMRGFAQSDAKIPAEWSHLVATLLPACFDFRDNPWLAELGRRSLPPDALPHFVGQVARGGLRGRIAAKQFVDDGLARGLIQEKTWPAHRAAVELINAWADAGEWEKALNHATLIPPDNDLGVPVGRCLHLATIATARAQSTVVKQILGFLEDEIRPRSFTMKRSYEVIGQVAALRLKCIVGTNGGAIKDISLLEKIADKQLRLLRKQFPDEPLSAFVTIECALAEAFAGPFATHHARYAEEWQPRAVAHWKRAVECWTEMKAWPGASTLEIFQHAMWLAQTTLHLIAQKCWSEDECARLTESWVTRVRAVLGLEDDDAALGEMLAIPPSETMPKEYRLMEPKEHDQAITAAIDILLRIDGVSPSELARIIRRARNVNERALSISRCIYAWHSHLPIDVAKAKVTELLDYQQRFKAADRAYGWAHWARFCLLKGQRSEAMLGILRSIERGVEQPTDRNATTGTELAATVAMQLSPGSRRDELCRQAEAKVAAKRYAPSSLTMARWMDLAWATRTDRQWCERYLSRAKELLPPKNAPIRYLRSNIDVLAAYSRRLGRLDSETAAHRVLADARAMAARIATVSGRVQSYCEIAEIGVVGGFLLDSDLLFREARNAIPGSSATKPLGAKIKELRTFLLSEWISSLAKALSHSVTLRGLSGMDVGVLRRWSDWVLEPSNRDIHWEMPPNDGGATFLAQVKRTAERDEVMRARAVAAKWRCQFDSLASPDQRKTWGETSDASLDSISSPLVRTRAFRDLAVLDAYAAYYDRRRAHHALRTVRIIGTSAQKDDVMHRVATAFANNYLRALEEGKSDAGTHLRLFTATLGDCAESHTSAYLALANLARCFPESARKLDTLLAERGILELQTGDETSADEE